MGNPERGRLHVVILGGGFAGLAAARALARAPVRITLIDRRNHHLFQPLLYQVATAALSAPDIAAPIRRVLRRQRNATVLMAEVTAIDVARRRVLLDDGEVGYDFLIVATGAVTSYFGHDEWAPHARGLKTIGDALEIRRRVLTAYEAAERETDPLRRAEWLTFVVIGGGPTGVEMAGALAEIARLTLAPDFRTFAPESARVVLLEGTDRVLPAFPPGLSRAAERDLARLGVEVRTGTRVNAIDDRGVELGAERVAARTVVWAAGVAASPLARSLGVPLDRMGRVRVAPDLSIDGHPEVFVIGDLAAIPHGDGTVPGLAPAALQAGRHAARCIRRDLASRPRAAFRYRDKGALATIGRRAAVADFGRLRFRGSVAWVLWLVVHILFLIGFRNRFVVMLEWSIAYWTRQRSARVIVEPPECLDRRSSLPPSE